MHCLQWTVIFFKYSHCTGDTINRGMSNIPTISEMETIIMSHSNADNSCHIAIRCQGGVQTDALDVIKLI